MKEVDRATAEILSNRVREEYPELRQRPKPERVRFLNGIEQIALDEGPDAVTPDRIQGMRELFEEVMWADPVLAQVSEDS